MKFYQVEEVFNKYLHIENNRDFLPAVFGAIIANRLDALPVWLIFMGKASTSKSEVLGALDNCLEIHMISKITDKSLASNVNMSAREMKGKEEPSLLDKIDGKILVLRDASSLISMSADKQKVFFSDLRTAFDGKFESSSGISQKNFEAKFGVMIAATPELERQRTMESELGERFLTYRLNPENEDAVWGKIDENSNLGEGEMKEALSDACIRYLNTCPMPKKVEGINFDIRNLAKAIAHGRTRVRRNRYNKQIEEAVEVSEAPFRVGKQLAAYYTGLMAVTGSHGRSMNILRKVARDSMRPAIRPSVIHAILNGQDTIKKLSVYLRLNETSVKYIIADMGHLGMLMKVPGEDKREKVLKLRPGFEAPFTTVFGV